MLHLKSIDVGSMFLMDLSVHESDLNNETNAFNSLIIDTDSVFPKTNLSSSQNNIIDTKNSPTTYDHLNSTSGYSLNDISKNNHKKQTTQPSSCERIAYHRSTQGNYNLGNSLDRLASAINGSLNDEELIDQNQFGNNINDEIDIEKEGKISQVTIVEPQPPPEIENQFSSASSLSDESYVASSGSATSYTASCESVGADDDDDDDQGSTTTREDSGVLDIKDLGNYHFSNSCNNEDICQQQQQQKQRSDHHQEKAISSNIMATNLINKSANNIDQNNSALILQNFSSSSINTNNDLNMNNKPTNNQFNHQKNHHHNHSHRNTSFSQPKRSMSASLPIEVPPRQMKRELKKSKKDYKNNQTDNKAQEVKNSRAAATATNSKRNIDDVLDDDFLDQEYNENHHNHYPIDEFDEEPLRAEENPMKLFESIQALARSLHEDAELFGSLPPKRMLESPIRSLIFS